MVLYVPHVYSHKIVRPTSEQVVLYTVRRPRRSVDRWLGHSRDLVRSDSRAR